MENPLVRVALAGNPNCGKTTLFNSLTGSSREVGNYPGVTVEKVLGYFTLGDIRFELVDLPGIYGLGAQSDDERASRDYLLDEKPDLILNLLDESALSRSLYLTAQLQELEIPLVLCLNKGDLAEKSDKNLNFELFCDLVGVPVARIQARKGKGLSALTQLLKSFPSQHLKALRYEAQLEKSITILQEVVESEPVLREAFPVRYASLKLLEEDERVSKLASTTAMAPILRKVLQGEQKRLDGLLSETTEERILGGRYGWAHGIVRECQESVGETARFQITDRVDSVLVHPVYGLPIFVLVMWSMFHFTFTLGEVPMGWIESLFEWATLFVRSTMPEGMFTDLLVDGVLAGVGGVLTFLPNIMILFFCIAVLEDSGYITRAAFLLDRFMHRIGLHGKSFIPMLVGFGCTVPAYMSSRILESKRDRLITMHVNTFMSCGARLPVYVLFAGAFWPIEQAGTVLFSIYIIGILVAIAVAKALSIWRYPGLSSPFVMELPPYNRPTLRAAFSHMWMNASMYLRKAGTVILLVSVVMWGLMTFPQTENYSRDYVGEIQLLSETQGGESKILELENARSAEDLEASFAGRIGKLVEPVIEPLGFDWRLGIGLFAGFAAKEILVSTLGNVYSVGNVDENSDSLRNKLRNDKRYSSLTAFSLLIFVLLYFPCMSAMTVFHKEAGAWRETIFQLGLTGGLAYGLTFLVYQGGRLLGLG